MKASAALKALESIRISCISSPYWETSVGHTIPEKQHIARVLLRHHKIATEGIKEILRIDQSANQEIVKCVNMWEEGITVMEAALKALTAASETNIGKWHYEAERLVRDFLTKAGE